ncbi:protein-tyrosine phosphatase-like protein, partial [Papiliotrema laurentii]
VDSVVEYTPFAHERGPLNISYVHESCVLLEKELRVGTPLCPSLTVQINPGKVVCLYTRPEPSAKANILLIAALYHLICNQSYPWQAFEPVAQLEVMPFRDAGKGSNDHGLTIEDCLYAMHKALQYDLIDLGRFSKSWYRHYERVQNGDLNLLADFIAFASPIEDAWARRYSQYVEALAQGKQPHWPSLPLAKSLPQPFVKLLGVFEEKNVGVVVRLNDELYDKRHFTDRGIHHVDLYFDDGSNPSDEIVREFITLSTEYIERRKQRVAVHCKAGLGRTGVLIGAYLIYKYHFSAQEAIGLMRLVRPGMVVGEQQQYMLLNQMKWVTWVSRIVSRCSKRRN